MSFSEAFFALLPPLHAILRGDVEDDFDDSEEGLAAQEAEYERAAVVAGNLGVPPRRSGRAGLAASTAAADAARATMRGRRCRRTSESFSITIRRTFTGRAAAGRVLVVY